MTRRMSCSMTVGPVRHRTKTVTRRHIDTWRNLQPGDRLTLVEKAMGLPKGAHQVRLADVEIIDVTPEPIGMIDQADVIREGFPEMTPAEFITMWLRSHGYSEHDSLAICKRIEWRYLDDPHQYADGRPVDGSRWRLTHTIGGVRPGDTVTVRRTTAGWINLAPDGDPTILWTLDRRRFLDNAQPIHDEATADG